MSNAIDTIRLSNKMQFSSVLSDLEAKSRGLHARNNMAMSEDRSLKGLSVVSREARAASFSPALALRSSLEARRMRISPQEDGVLTVERGMQACKLMVDVGTQTDITPIGIRAKPKVAPKPKTQSVRPEKCNADSALVETQVEKLTTPGGLGANELRSGIDSGQDGPVVETTRTIVKPNSVGFTTNHNFESTMKKYSSITKLLYHNHMVCKSRTGFVTSRRVVGGDVYGQYQIAASGSPTCSVKFKDNSFRTCYSIFMKCILTCFTSAATGAEVVMGPGDGIPGHIKIKNLGGLDIEEYTMLCVGNSAYPATGECATVWSKLIIPHSGVSVAAKGKTANLSPTVAWEALNRLAVKLERVNEFRDAITDTIGLAEYAVATGATAMEVWAQPDDNRTIRVNARGESLGLDIQDCMCASLVQGDELMLIHIGAGDGSRYRQQWDTLLRTSFILSNGKARTKPQELTRAILSEHGYFGSVMPEMEHGGYSCLGACTDWLIQVKECVTTGQCEDIFGIDVIGECVRATYLKDMNTFAMTARWDNFAAYVESMEYAAIFDLRGDEDRAWLGAGEEVIYILPNGKNIAILSKYGRHNYWLTQEMRSRLLRTRDKLKMMKPTMLGGL